MLTTYFCRKKMQTHFFKKKVGIEDQLRKEYLRNAVGKIACTKRNVNSSRKMETTLFMMLFVNSLLWKKNRVLAKHMVEPIMNVDHTLVMAEHVVAGEKKTLSSGK